MKARIKATGEIVEVEFVERKTHTGEQVYMTHEGCLIEESRLDFNVEPIDYWTRLEHTYAGMAMQGLSEKYFKEYRDYCAGFGDMDEDEAKGAMKDFANAMADVCYYFAHALVEKMKEAFKIECK